MTSFYTYFFSLLKMEEEKEKINYLQQTTLHAKSLQHFKNKNLKSQPKHPFPPSNIWFPSSSSFLFLFLFSPPKSISTAPPFLSLFFLFSIFLCFSLPYNPQHPNPLHGFNIYLDFRIGPSQFPTPNSQPFNFCEGWSTTEASVVEEPNTPKVPPTEEPNAATQLVTKHSKAQSNSGPRRPRKPPTWMNDYVVSELSLFSLFFLFLLNLFSVFSLLRSGDIGADTRSKSALVLTGHFAGRTYQLVLSSTPLMADLDVLLAVKALQDQFEAQFESQTMSFHQILQQYMSTVDSRLEEFRSQFHGSSGSRRSDYGFIFNGFKASASNLSLGGASLTTPNGALRLTNSSPNLTGHAFYNTPFHFLNKNSHDSQHPTTASSFATTFIFAIVPSYVGGSGGHGFVFTVSPSKNLSDAWIEYDGAQKIVNVTISPASLPKPSKPLLSLAMDLSPIFKESMYVGFSAATGKHPNSHYILGWSLKMGRTEEDPLDLSKIPSPPRNGTPSPGLGRRRGIEIGAASTMVTLALLLCGITISVYMLRRARLAEVLEDWELDFPHRFRYKDLYIATKGFKESQILGKGVFGDLLLVYDYMSNGSLDTFLFQEDKNLDWGQRFRILKEIAAGLLYLHEEWEQFDVVRAFSMGRLDTYGLLYNNLSF
ncbi:unnamed protein product, partial [Vitis vinifera]